MTSTVLIPTLRSTLCVPLLIYLTPTHIILQIAILNAASIPGRVIPNILADYYGALNVVIPISLIMGALVFVMFGVTNTPAIIIFSILYGFFSGACKHPVSSPTPRALTQYHADIALVPSVLSVLSHRTEELGYVPLPFNRPSSLTIIPAAYVWASATASLPSLCSRGRPSTAPSSGTAPFSTGQVLSYLAQ